uniref:Uncharacterized protein n=1 Tax=viral metagenome TaxID=1070528 RepID=A0A6H1ZTX9_9ZZZZ
MKINLTKLLFNPRAGEFVNRHDIDAAYTILPWFVVQDQTSQPSDGPYSFRIEGTTEQDLLEDRK